MQGYAANIDEVDFQSLVPAKLQQDRSILFTNISEIHEFHARQVTCMIQISLDLFVFCLFFTFVVSVHYWNAFFDHLIVSVFACKIKLQ